MLTYLIQIFVTSNHGSVKYHASLHVHRVHRNEADTMSIKNVISESLHMQ